MGDRKEEAKGEIREFLNLVIVYILDHAQINLLNVKGRDRNVTVSETIETYLDDTGTTQQELANKLFIDRSLISKIKSGKAKWNEEHDSKLSEVNWRFALHLMHERSGGYLTDILELDPKRPLHLAIWEDYLIRDMKEALKALDDIIFDGTDNEESREKAEKAWYEIKDVMDKGAIMLGLIEEEFGFNRKALSKKYELEVKQRKR